MFLNKSKEQRAKDVINSPKHFPEDSVERKALALGQAEKLEGDALVDYVYRKIGGAVKGEAPKVDLPTGEISVETSGQEVEEVGKKRRARK